MRIKKMISSLTYERQMFVKLLVLVTLPLIVMGIVSCNIYIKGESTRNQMALNSYGDEISREYENILSSLKEYYIEAVNGEDVRWLVSQEKPPYSSYSDLKKAQNSIEGNYFLKKYIADYELMNVKNGWVFNNYGMFAFDQLKNQKETNHFLEEQERMLLSVYWLNRSEIPSPIEDSMRISNTVDTSGLRLVLKKEQGIGEISWLLTIKLDREELKKMSITYKKMGYDVAIIGKENVLLETDSKMTNAYLNSDRNVSGVYQSKQGDTYHIQIQAEPITGLKYLVGYNEENVKKGAFVFVLASFGVLAGFILLLFLIRLTVIAFAKPLKSLEKYVGDQEEQIKKLLVSNLIEGQLNEKSMEGALRKSEIVSWPVYRMIAINCKWKPSEEDTRKERYESILAKFPEELKKDVFISPVYYRDKLIFIIGAEKDMEVDSKTALFYKDLKDYIADVFGFCIASGISQPFHKLHHVRRAYGECAEALYNKSNQSDTNASSLVLFDDDLLKSQVGNVYDMILENELIQSMMSGKEEESACFLELIIERMERKNVVGIERSFYLTRLLTAMLNIPAAQDISLSDVFDSEQYNLLNTLPQIYDKKKIVEAITKEVIHPIIETLTKKRQEGKESVIVKKTVALIKDTKGNISLNQCARQLSYHPNYLSKILKKEKGITFTDMVNEEKLKLAKYMLLTTEYSVADISERLMYNNVQNFIRFFKKHVGNTPAAFRKEHRK